MADIWQTPIITIDADIILSTGLYPVLSSGVPIIIPGINDPIFLFWGGYSGFLNSLLSTYPTGESMIKLMEIMRDQRNHNEQQESLLKLININSGIQIKLNTISSYLQTGSIRTLNANIP